MSRAQRQIGKAVRGAVAAGALSFIALWALWALCALCASQLALAATAGPPIAAEALERSISERIGRVEEFVFIRQACAELKTRCWLFGGTAAGYGHYVKWDLQREAGDKRFQPDRFDYDYTNIFRSTQDADLVVDGSPEQAAELERRLADRYGHLQGSKVDWEVRLLRQQRGEKEALLHNPDFLNQHTDSNSTGMIELTRPPEGEGVVRDLRAWDAKPKESGFFKDVLEGKIRYYFSNAHGSTSRAARGMNPSIFSVIRYFTKAFQYDLELRPDDLQFVRQLIDGFDPARELSNDYTRKWIEKNGKKLYQHAVNIEYAWNKLEELGLRRKLVSWSDPKQKDSLGWWLDRVPLRSYPVGLGEGVTAAELGIDTVAHGTSDFLAYESITRAHTGEPNALISRANVPGETALLGDGFYVLRGTTGGMNPHLSIRFKVDPAAREGRDFKRTSMEGIYLIWNKQALKVIPESLSVTPVGYFEMLAGGFGFSDDDGGVHEKLRRRLNTKFRAIGEDELAQIRSILTAELGKPQPSSRMFEEFVGLRPSLNDPENLKILRRMMKTPALSANTAETLFKDAAQWKNPAVQELLDLLVSDGVRNDKVNLALVDILLQQDWDATTERRLLAISAASGEEPEISRRIIQRVVDRDRWRTSRSEKALLSRNIGRLLDHPAGVGEEGLDIVFDRIVRKPDGIEVMRELGIFERLFEEYRPLTHLARKEGRLEWAFGEVLTRPEFINERGARWVHRLLDVEHLTVGIGSRAARTEVIKKLISHPEWQKRPEMLPLISRVVEIGPEAAGNLPWHFSHELESVPFWREHPELVRLSGGRPVYSKLHHAFRDPQHPLVTTVHTFSVSTPVYAGSMDDFKAMLSRIHPWQTDVLVEAAERAWQSGKTPEFALEATLAALRKMDSVGRQLFLERLAKPPKLPRLEQLRPVIRYLLEDPASGPGVLRSVARRIFPKVNVSEWQEELRLLAAKTDEETLLFLRGSIPEASRYLPVAPGCVTSAVSRLAN